MGFPDWTTEPIPGLKISAGGLLTLADLSTAAQRTAIAGGSSWLDSLLLVPGLHYQQAADALVQDSAGYGGPHGILNAIETLQDGKPVTFTINNAATRHYIQKIARPDQVITLDVGEIPRNRARYRLKRSGSGKHAMVWAEDKMPDLGWLSHLLYLSSPALTVVAIIFIVLLQDWWSLGSLFALIFARLMNIIVIKQRSSCPNPKPPPTKLVKPAPGGAKPDQPCPPSETSSEHPDSSPSLPHITEYIVKFGDGHSAVRLRGLPDDLKAITADAWLRTKTSIDGYLEAMAKLLVYLVAALSGNMTQAGGIIFMCLLLISAGLLALSNAHARSFRMRGRVAFPLPPADLARILEGKKPDPPYPTGRSRVDTKSWPPSVATSSQNAMDDWAERGQAGAFPRRSR